MQDLPDLNDMLLFAEVAERGSFTAASDALGMPKSRVSRRVAAPIVAGLPASHSALPTAVPGAALGDVSVLYASICPPMAPDWFLLVTT